MSLQVTFLGTGLNPPTVARNPPSICLRYDNIRLLFDCGEGTQRQILRYGTGFKIGHVFLTQFDYGRILGLPGLLQTMEFNDHAQEICIHTPEGTKRQLKNFISINGSYGFSVEIHETHPPSTVVQKADYIIKCFRTGSGDSEVGYSMVEDDRKGRFIREEAEKLGVPEGPAFSRLHRGESIELDDGKTIDPEQVVGPPRPGRSIVYTGKTRPTKAVVNAAENVDLLIHDAAYTNSQSDKAQKSGHSTAEQAGEVAASSGAKRLALVHFSGRYHSDDTHVYEAENAAPDADIFNTKDGQHIQLKMRNTHNEYTPISEIRKQELQRTGAPTTNATADSSPDSRQQTAVATEQETEKAINRKTSGLAILRKQAEEEAKERVEVTTNSSSRRATEYSRSKAVSEYVKARASGHCEGCDDPAPFKNKTGEPYLHAHHVFELSDGGSDTPDTVVALCPNCHYRVHHGQDGDEYNTQLYETVQQLERQE